MKSVQKTFIQNFNFRQMKCLDPYQVENEENKDENGDEVIIMRLVKMRKREKMRKRVKMRRRMRAVNI